MGNYSNKINHFFEKRRQYGIKPGLDRVNSLLKSIGNPEKHLKTVHITGTNGKGSTIAYLNDSLMAQGYQVGVFSSPSFTGLCGHIKINNKQILDNIVYQYIQDLMPHINQLDRENNHPSEFEIITVIAMCYFKNRVDIALIETGMGARLDTTNCIEPLVSVITSIALDHIDYLGDTVEQITHEKAGIIKEKTPAVIGLVPEESKTIIINEARKINSPLYFINNHFTYKAISLNKFTYKDEQLELKADLTMLGKHQIANAAIALKTLVLLQETGYLINWQKVLKSIRKTKLPGRLEVMSTQPHIILDGAHNESSMKALTKTLRDMYTNKNIHVIFAAFKDKQIEKMSKLINDSFNTITLTTFHHDRAMSTDDLSRIFLHSDTMINDNWKQIIDDLYTKDQDEINVVTGSLHFIFLVRHYIDKKFN